MTTGKAGTVSSRKPLLMWDAEAPRMSFHFPDDSHLLGPPLDGLGPPREKMTPTPGWPWQGCQPRADCHQCLSQHEFLHTHGFGGSQPSRSCWVSCKGVAEGSHPHSVLEKQPSCPPPGLRGPRLLRLLTSHDYICLSGGWALLLPWEPDYLFYKISHFKYWQLSQHFLKLVAKQSTTVGQTDCVGLVWDS